MEGGVGLSIKTASKQSALNCCVADITVVDRSKRHAALGKWVQAARP